MSGAEDRLARWSRLKAEGAAPAPESAPAQEEADAAFVAALPTIEEIDAATDIRGFLRAGVPAALRAAALTRAWMSDPSIRDRIPDAIDYAEDYNAPHTISGWGPACPQEARAYVERTLEPVRPADEAPPDDAPPREVAQASREEVAPEEPADAEPAEAEPADAEPADAEPAEAEPAEAEPSQDAAAAPAETGRGPITKTRSRHGGALPFDG